MLSTETAGLAIKIAKGLIKTTGRIDVMFADKAAVTRPPFPMLNSTCLLREIICTYKTTVQALELPPYRIEWRHLNLTETTR